MLTSFSTALSALNAHSTAIDVVGNNLANLNTPGFKASAVSFHDLVSQSLGTSMGETQVGFGVGRPITLRQFSQGAIQSSSGPLNAAIQGDGFFVVKSQEGATLLTRGGHLQVDSSGNLKTPTGQKVQGWINLDPSGAVDTNAPLGDIVVPVGTLRPAVVTENLSMDLNLNAASAAGAVFSNSIEVFDSLGGSHTVKISFTKSATANEWDYQITVPDTDVSTPVNVTGQLTFDTAGRLQSPGATAASPAIAITGLRNGAANMTVNWNLWNNGAARLTQYSQPSAVSAVDQDGATAANLIRVGLADGGKVLAEYSNGEQTVVGQVAMATIRNPESLIGVGDNNYAMGAQSALPAIGLPSTGGRGRILGGAIEASTADIAKEFTNLIVLQRGYQANARVVTTVDQLSEETMNLKR